jgi:hypothetical protein
MKVRINNVRVAFPVLFNPKSVNGEGDPAFSASFILDPVANKADLKVLDEAIVKAAEEKWGPKAATILAGLRKSGKVCLRDGDEKPEYDGYPGNMFVSARSKSRPLVIDRDKTPLVEADGRPYGGAFVNAVLDLWAQDNDYGKRVNATLSGVQFVRDGDAFGGGRPASADEFDEVEETEESLV